MLCKLYCCWHRCTISLIVLSSIIATAQAREDADPDKKIIVFGYDTQLAHDIPHRMDLYEKRPFQGMVIGARLKREFDFPPNRKGSSDRLGWVAWGNELTNQDLDKSIQQLASRRDSQTITELFMRFNVTPGNVDWFDDEAWEQRVNNSWRLIGKMVREGRLRGIMFDTELYTGFVPLFSYRFASQNGQYSWPQCVDQAYRRGQQAMWALNEQVKDLDIMLTFANGYAARAMASSDYSALQRTSNGLVPAFLDGMMNAKDSLTRIYDGWEFSYRYKTRDEFREAAYSIHNRGAEISLDPETYFKNMHASFGIWMCDSPKRWDPENPYYTAEQLEEVIGYAYEFTDRYIWLYHERIQPWGVDKGQELFPEEYWKAIRRASAPFAEVDPTRPIDSRPTAAPGPRVEQASPPAQLMGYWPLRNSLSNETPGGPVLKGLGAIKFAPFGESSGSSLRLDGKRSHLFVPTNKLPSGLGRDATICISVVLTEADLGRRYPVLSGSIGQSGFEVAAIGCGGELRFEVTLFDYSGRPIGWQTTGVHYDPYEPYSLAIRFSDGQFDGLNVNTHQAIYGLWDLNSSTWSPLRASQPGHDPVLKRRCNTDHLFVGVSAQGSLKSADYFSGVISDLRLFNASLDRAKLEELYNQLEDWVVPPASPGFVRLDFKKDGESDGRLTDKWAFPSQTPFGLKTNGSGMPQFVAFQGGHALQFDVESKPFVESLALNRESQPLDHVAYTIRFQLESLPDSGSAYGLFGRGDGSNRNTSFAVYVGSEGQVYVHGKTTNNYAKNLQSDPGKIVTGVLHELTLSLDRPNGILAVNLDGHRIASTSMAMEQGLQQFQSLRYRPLPVRIGHVYVQPNSLAPFDPKPAECYLDGVVTEFRIEPISN